MANDMSSGMNNGMNNGMNHNAGNPENSPLGQNSEYPDQYDASLLYPIPRSQGRESFPESASLPFNGVDIWNAYEVSWLNSKGKPNVAVAVLRVPALSPNIVESKSLKLYLGSLNQSVFDNVNDVIKTIQHDVGSVVGASIDVAFEPPIDSVSSGAVSPGANGPHLCIENSECIDTLDIEASEYTINPQLLELDNISEGAQTLVEECLSSHLLRSNCPVTGQPDWATLYVHYQGPKICRESLLKYIVSYRNHNDFHEQCVERVFMDVMAVCQPTKLSVYGRYTRRGGIDINPFRSNFESCENNTKLARQ